MFVKSDVMILPMFEFHENRRGVFGSIPVLEKLNNEDIVVVFY